MDSELDAEDALVEKPFEAMPCCQRCCVLDACIREFSVRLAAASTRRIMYLPDRASSDLPLHLLYRCLWGKPCRFLPLILQSCIDLSTICLLAMLNMTTSFPHFSKPLAFDGPSLAWPGSTERQQTVVALRLFDCSKSPVDSARLERPLSLASSACLALSLSQS